jgi:nucleotide-binding universal stress UspA family protein
MVTTHGDPSLPAARAIFRRILVPTDGSRAARSADAVAVGLAQVFHGKVRFVVVLDVEKLVSDLTMGSESDVSHLVEELRPIASRVLNDVARLAVEAGVDADALLREGDVVDCILEEAATWRADVIVIGTHARPHPFVPTLGSKTHELLRRSNLPVLVCR